MEREAMEARLAALMDQLRQQVDEYNLAIGTKNLEGAAQKEKEYTDTLKLANDIAWQATRERLSETNDPMLAAVYTLEYEIARVKDVKEEGGDGIACPRTVVSGQRKIDLLKLDRYCKGIGKEKDWNNKLEKYLFLMTLRAANELGIDPKEVSDSYLMSDLVRKQEMGKTPTSNTALLKGLQAVVTAMLGEECKATSKDVAFLLHTFTRKGKSALTVAISNPGNFRNLIAEVCHRIATDKAYKLEYKKAKEADPVSALPGAVAEAVAAAPAA